MAAYVSSSAEVWNTWSLTSTLLMRSTAMVLGAQQITPSLSFFLSVKCTYD